MRVSVWFSIHLEGIDRRNQAESNTREKYVRLLACVESMCVLVCACVCLCAYIYALICLRESVCVLVCLHMCAYLLA